MRERKGALVEVADGEKRFCGKRKGDKEGGTVLQTDGEGATEWG